MGTGRDHGVISEIALCSASLAEFERELIAYLQPILGFDTACTVWSDHEGGVRHVTALEYREARLQRDFPRFMSELSPEELLAFASVEPVLDTHVLAQPRRSRLAVYRELLEPFGVSQFVTNVYHSRFGVFGFHFGRTGALRALPQRLRLRPLGIDRSALPGVQGDGRARGADCTRHRPATACPGARLDGWAAGGSQLN
jgi:hypothetical protein